MKITWTNSFGNQFVIQPSRMVCYLDISVRGGGQGIEMLGLHLRTSCVNREPLRLAGQRSPNDKLNGVRQGDLWAFKTASGKPLKIASKILHVSLVWMGVGVSSCPHGTSMSTLFFFKQVAMPVRCWRAAQVLSQARGVCSLLGHLLLLSHGFFSQVLCGNYQD